MSSVGERKDDNHEEEVKVCSVGSSKVWLISCSNQVYVMLKGKEKGKQPKRIPNMSLQDVSVGLNDYTLGIGMEGEVYEWQNEEQRFSKLAPIDMVYLKQISVGHFRNVWGLKQDGSVWKLKDDHKRWKRIHDCHFDVIACGKKDVWGLDRKQRVMARWDGSYFKKEICFPSVGFDIMDIDVAKGDQDILFATTADGKLLQWDQMKQEWNELFALSSGQTLTNISVSEDHCELYGIDKHGHAFLYYFRVDDSIVPLH